MNDYMLHVYLTPADWPSTVIPVYLTAAIHQLGAAWLLFDIKTNPSGITEWRNET